jgi:glutamine amidotransferase
MRVAILDYQAGNQTSVQRALAHLGVEAAVTADPAAVAAADRVVFPGVGAAGSCMANLRAAGLDQAIADVVAAGKPLLCVCIGMQLLFEFSDEDGGTPCLGVLPGLVERFQPEDPAIKVPHMGWNSVVTTGDPLFRDIPAGACFYFVHSYYCAPGTDVEVIATSDHGGGFCAGVRRGNLAAVQFHPEKSGPAGLKLLENFLKADAVAPAGKRSGAKRRPG